ncbi:MAG: ClpXP protease specificity-enhancing factor SspB [Thermoanaerobaculia bacterium]|nr:ClpXP protease specificity-enhancing factor SspB [Thermoanaerobaculia bacterium]
MSDSFDTSSGDSSPPEEPAIEYTRLVQEALRQVVRSALEQVADLGLPGEHHFYISFRTLHRGVGLSDGLRTKHPEEMTIVLQHDFRDLEVDEEGFDVTLRFGGIPQSIRVPLEAVTAFFDPSVHFMLRFDAETGEIEDTDSDQLEYKLGDAAGSGRIPTDILRKVDISSVENAQRAAETTGVEDGEVGTEEPGGKVVSLEAFRRK